MHLTKVLPLVASVALFPFSGAAKTHIAAEAPVLLGQRYVELNGGVDDFRHQPNHGLHGGLMVNVPVCRHADVRLSYEHSDFRGSYYDGVLGEYSRSNRAMAELVGHVQCRSMKPFLAVGVGRQWNDATVTFGGVEVGRFTDHSDGWKITAGAEVPVSHVVLVPSISTTDSVHRTGNYDARAWMYGLDLHVSVTQRVSAYAGIGYSHAVAASAEYVWGYRGGVRFAF